MSQWILLRGLTRESAHWGDFTDQLQRALPDDRVVAVDLPGTGRRRNRTSPMRVELIVNDCRRQLQDRGLVPPFRLVGISLGGMVAAAWMFACADEVDACVLVNSSFRSVSPLVQRLRPGSWPRLLRVLATLSPERAEHLVLAITSNDVVRRRAILGAWTEIRRRRPVPAFITLRQLIAAARYQLPNDEPPAPVLLLSSQGDRLVDPKCSRALARRWQCDLAEHPTAGHDLALDAGDWMATAIARRFGGRG